MYSTYIVLIIWYQNKQVKFYKIPLVILYFEKARTYQFHNWLPDVSFQIICFRIYFTPTKYSGGRIPSDLFQMLLEWKLG